MKKRILPLLLALVMCMGLVTVPASALNEGEEWVGDFVVRNGTTLVKYYGEDSAVTIPAGITKIGDRAFQDCTSLTSVTIPNSVTEIGSVAFYRCANLTSVNIPNSVTWIGNSAFWGCHSLTSITIPNGVTVINEDTFNGCRSLTSITIPDSVVKIGFEAFTGCAALTSVTIPNGVTEIGNDAFAYCTSLTSVTIPDSVTLFGYRAFYRCTGLTSVTIGSGVTTIQESMFEGCTSLTSVIIPDRVTTLYNRAFQGCSSLTSVTIPLSVTYIHWEAFDGCTALTDVYYAGSAVQWKAVKDPSNVPDTATIHYNSTGPAPVTPNPDPPSSPIDAYQFSGWAKESVAAAFDAGLVPENALNDDLTAGVTRAQFAAVAVKLYEAMSGQKAPAVTESPFDDTNDPYVLQAHALELVSGNGAGGFDPDGTMTREMAATLLSKVFIKLGGEIPKANATGFADDGQISFWARDSVSFMSQKGIVSGNGSGSFDPKDDMTGEGALILALQMLQGLEV